MSKITSLAEDAL